ncbi:amidohydrolase family protein [Gordonia sp. SL306]|uniref:amidohydrolase family protein n=1 Tax=Gordonia sp. SL306 TaxID=2995145 RepID=UPI0022712A33|nr:amidohydrolase family protein [Gordonia sp. SL306]WAC57517.1 amidohydrolase family protein [Gordonia sp. SL306]
MPDHVVDAHVHLWDLNHPWYPGLQAMAESLGQPELYSDFGLDDYSKAAGSFPVEKFVHVSAVTAPRTYLDELRWVSTVASDHDVDMHFIGTVDPTLPEAELLADLDAQLAVTPHFRGIRVLYDLPPESSSARTILHWLDDHELVFDLVTHPDTMDDWLRTIGEYPDLEVVLEHTGWPTGVDDDARTAWRRAIADCAQRSRASCKVSGLGMTTVDLSASALRPWVEPAVDAFGWDRVIFGSNIPIEHMAGRYAELVESLDSIIGAATPDEQDCFYRRNAVRVYGFEE